MSASVLLSLCTRSAGLQDIFMCSASCIPRFLSICVPSHSVFISRLQDIVRSFPGAIPHSVC